MSFTIGSCVYPESREESERKRESLGERDREANPPPGATGHAVIMSPGEQESRCHKPCPQVLTIITAPGNSEIEKAHK